MLFPNLSLSEERSAKAAKRCRRERCNARQRTNAYSSNLGVEYGSASRQQHHFLTRCEKKESVVTTASVAPLPAPPSIGADLSSDKESLGPAEEIFCRYELCDARGFGCEAVDFLVADHRRGCEVDAVHLG